MPNAPNRLSAARGPTAEPGNESRVAASLHGRWSHLSTRHAGSLFAAPAVIYVVVMMAAPLAYTIYLSLHRWSGSALASPEAIGLGNYSELFSDEAFWRAAWQTGYFTILAVGLETVLGVGAAILLSQRKFRGKGIVQAALLIPMMTTPTAIALVWRLMYNAEFGAINGLLAGVGIEGPAWLAEQSLVIPALAIVDVWQWTPLIMLITLAGIAALPGDPFEAAAVDGASRWQMTRYITLPLLRPVVALAVGFRLIDTLKVFEQIYIITEGGPAGSSMTLNILAYITTFQYGRFGYASAQLVVLTLLIILSLYALSRKGTRQP